VKVKELPVLKSSFRVVSICFSQKMSIATEAKAELRKATEKPAEIREEIVHVIDALEKLACASVVYDATLGEDGSCVTGSTAYGSLPGPPSRCDASEVEKDPITTGAVEKS
jgi:hypothetical protein